VFGTVILYANAFSADLGRCFRWVCRESTWQPMRCPGEVSTREWWQDGTDLWWLVDACGEHAGPLRPTRPARSRVGLVGRVLSGSRGKTIKGSGNSTRRSNVGDRWIARRAA
jgi:hypothetical protein